MIPLGRLFAVARVPPEAAEKAKPEHLVKPLAFAIPALVAPEDAATELDSRLAESGAAHPLAPLADLADPTVIVAERGGRTVIALRGELVEAEVYSTGARIPPGEYTLGEFRRVAPRGIWLEAWRLARLAGYAGDTIELYAVDETLALALIAGRAPPPDAIDAEVHAYTSAPVARIVSTWGTGYTVNWRRGSGAQTLRLRVVHSARAGRGYATAAVIH